MNRRTRKARASALAAIERMEHGLALARIAAGGEEPEEAVGYLRRAMKSAGQHLVGARGAVA
jgi:hypothetical protein